MKALRASLSGGISAPGELLGLEGRHLVSEAHRSGLSFETVYVREGNEAMLDRGWWPEVRARDWALLSREVFDGAVPTESPQGVAATWRLQEPAAPRELGGHLLVLEEVQDPGNVGTLIRSAEAFGARQVLATPGTASQWNPKVMRASAGSVFRVPVLREGLEEIVKRLRAQGIRLFAAVRGFTGEHVLAAPHGVLTGRVSNVDSQGRNRSADEIAEGSREGYSASLAYDTDFLPPCAILIGNEGAGLSPEALAMADEQVQIPCGVESLNAGVAGSILLYEAMRQLPLRQWATRQGLRP